MVAEFAAAIREGRPAGTDGAAGLRVLSVLEAAGTSLRARGAQVDVADSAARAGARPMTALAGARVLVTGGAGTIGSTIVDQLLDGRRRRTSTCWTTWCADAGATSTTPWPAAGSRWSRATSATATSCTTSTRGKDLVFHQAAIRITQCAEEPRLALEVLVDGTFNVVEAAVEARRRQARRRLVGVGLRPGRGVPDQRAAPPPQQRHVLRRGQVVQRGDDAQLPGHVRPGLRRCCATSTSTARGWTSTASTPRSWCAGWSGSPTASRR